MSERKHCDALLDVVDAMEHGLRTALKGIRPEHLNHVFAPHTMTIGQLAVHTMAWPQYFLSKTPPWDEAEGTCRPCEYPLTPGFVDTVIEDGCRAMRDALRTLDDGLLEANEAGEKGHGYILCRLQLHTLVHTCQIAYLRRLLEPDWDFDDHWGDMATAYIRMDYHTERDNGG